MLRHYALRIEQEVAISLLFSNGQRHTSESALPLVSICRAVLVLTGKLSYRKEPCYTKLPSANALNEVHESAARVVSCSLVSLFVCLLVFCRTQTTERIRGNATDTKRRCARDASRLQPLLFSRGTAQPSTRHCSMGR